MNGRHGRSPFAYVGIGFELVVPILIGVYGGYRLDRWLDTSPWLLIAGSLLGCTTGMVQFLRTVAPSTRGGGDGSGDAPGDEGP